MASREGLRLPLLDSATVSAIVSPGGGRSGFTPVGGTGLTPLGGSISGIPTLTTPTLTPTTLRNIEQMFLEQDDLANQEGNQHEHAAGFEPPEVSLDHLISSNDSNAENSSSTAPPPVVKAEPKPDLNALAAAAASMGWPPLPGPHSNVIQTLNLSSKTNNSNNVQSANSLPYTSIISLPSSSSNPLPGPTTTKLLPPPTSVPLPGPNTTVVPLPGPNTTMVPLPGPNTTVVPLPGPVVQLPVVSLPNSMVPFPGPQDLSRTAAVSSSGGDVAHLLPREPVSIIPISLPIKPEPVQTLHLQQPLQDQPSDLSVTGSIKVEPPMELPVNNSARVVPPQQMELRLSGAKIVPPQSASKSQPSKMNIKNVLENVALPPDVERKKELRRQRNKEAAARCRKRRMDKISTLEEEVNEWVATNTDLKEEIAALEAAKAQLEKVMKAHRPICNAGSSKSNEGNNNQAEPKKGQNGTRAITIKKSKTSSVKSS